MHIDLPRGINPAAIFQLHRPMRSAGLGRHRFGPWTLEIQRDAFTGVLSCSLRAHRMVFMHASVAFQFSPNLNTFDADYRRDSAAAMPWRTNLMALAGHGVRFQTDDLRNPSGGLVAIPYNAIMGAQAVWIRPSPRSTPVRFKVDRLPIALEVAKRDGCDRSLLGAEPE